MRLVIADDSEILRTRLCELLSEIDGITIVGQANDCPSCVEAVQNLRPDVVILDIRIPGGDGITALETIKKLEHAPKVIMFTSFPYLQYRKRCLDMGADFFFYKANEFEQLLKAVRELAVAV
ncbi:MAG: response regulator transcription factor [Candidatus Aminicenantales bacterium]